ncbi:MAG: hypothetical protein ACJ73N_06675 [Bryobacteraceae bacterium]
MFNTHIKVDVQQHVLVDPVLTPGQNTQKITVSDEPPALQTYDASVGQVTSGFKCSPSRNGAMLNFARSFSI